MLVLPAFSICVEQNRCFRNQTVSNSPGFSMPHAWRVHLIKKYRAEQLSLNMLVNTYRHPWAFYNIFNLFGVLSNHDFINVFVSWGGHNKLPQAQRLKITVIYSFTVLEAGIISGHKGSICQIASSRTCSGESSIYL